MNFSELAKQTRLRVGMQGSGPDALSEAVGPESLIVQCVVDSYLDLQNYREDWKWLRATTDFNIGTVTETYTLGNIFGLTYRFKKWNTDNFYFLNSTGDYERLYYKEYYDFLRDHINDDTPSKPRYFTVVPEDSSLLFTPVDDIYSVKAPYQKAPQTLSGAGDIPELPEHYHRLIIYGAIEKFSVSIGSPELYQKYSMDHTNLLGSLLRSENPSKKIKMRSIA